MPARPGFCGGPVVLWCSSSVFLNLMIKIPVRLNRSGITLIAALMLILFVAVAVSGLSFFIFQRLSQNQTRDRHIGAVYLAQAGLREALYQYRSRDRRGNGYFTMGSYTVDGPQGFVLGAEPADLLMVDTANAKVQGKKENFLRGIKIQNATDSQTIAFNQMIVSWDNKNRLERIRIANLTVWNGNKRSPVTADLTRTITLNTRPSTYAVNYLRFDKSMTDSIVDVRFVMTDGGMKDVRVFPASNQFNFTVKATGKEAGANVYRTIQAEYNAQTGNVIGEREKDEQISP